MIAKKSGQKPERPDSMAVTVQAEDCLAITGSNSRPFAHSLLYQTLESVWLPQGTDDDRRERVMGSVLAARRIRTARETIQPDRDRPDRA